MTDYNAQTLDRLESDLRAATSLDPITSGELAARHFPDDSSGNPRTRKAIKHLMRQRGLPIIGVGNGYHIPESNAAVAEAVQSLQGRIDGIKERQQLLVDNWAAYSAVETDGGTTEDTTSPSASNASVGIATPRSTRYATTTRYRCLTLLRARYECRHEHHSHGRLFRRAGRSRRTSRFTPWLLTRRMDWRLWAATGTTSSRKNTKSGAKNGRVSAFAC